MNTVNIIKLGIAIGRYVAGNPELVAKIVLLTVKALEKITGVKTDDESRGIEDDAMLQNVLTDYYA